MHAHLLLGCTCMFDVGMHVHAKVHISPHLRGLKPSPTVPEACTTPAGRLASLLLRIAASAGQANGGCTGGLAKWSGALQPSPLLLPLLLPLPLPLPQCLRHACAFAFAFACASVPEARICVHGWRMVRCATQHQFRKASDALDKPCTSTSTAEKSPASARRENSTTCKAVHSRTRSADTLHHPSHTPLSHQRLHPLAL